MVDGVVHELRLALPCFFVLSGFLLYRGWVAAVLDERDPPSVRRYLAARGRRLVPGAWLCLLVAGPVLIVLLDDVRGLTVPPLELLPLFGLFLQGYHPDTIATLDPPMWTLTVEATFYVVLPVLAVLALLPARAAAGAPHRRAALLLPAVVLAVAGTLFNVWLVARPGDVVLSSSLLALAPLFAAGMAAAALGHGRTLGRGATWSLVAAGAALVVLNGWWHESGTAGATDAGRVWRDAIAGVGFAAVIAGTAHAARAPALLRSRALEWMGERSYGIYLWHMPAIYFLRGAEVFPEGRTAPALLAVLAVTLPIAHASWTWVEKPLLLPGGVLGRRRVPRSTAPARRARPAAASRGAPRGARPSEA